MLKGFRNFFKDLKNSNKAVSELIGTVLLLGIAVTIFSLIYISVLSISLYTNEPNPIIVATIEGSNIIFEHRGGEKLSLDTKVTIDIQNEKVLKTVGELLIDTNEDNQWNIGERLAYPFGYSLNSSEADVISIDVEGNKIILLGTLDIYPECDVGVEIFVSEKYPEIGSDIEITIKAIHYTGDTNATDIQIEYIMPDNLTYVGNTSTQGYYNNETGIWDVGEIIVGGSETVTITATVPSTEFLKEPITQFPMIFDAIGDIINTAKILHSIPPDINADNNIMSITIVPQYIYKTK